MNILTPEEEGRQREAFQSALKESKDLQKKLMSMLMKNYKGVKFLPETVARIEHDVKKILIDMSDDGKLLYEKD